MYQIKPFVVIFFSFIILFAYQNCAKSITDEQTIALNSLIANGNIESRILKNGPQFLYFKETIELKVDQDLELSLSPVLDYEEEFSFAWKKVIEGEAQSSAEIIDTKLGLIIDNAGDPLDISVLGNYKLYIYFRDKSKAILVKNLKIVEAVKSAPEDLYSVEGYSFDSNAEITVQEGVGLALNLSRSIYPIVNSVTVLAELDQFKFGGILSSVLNRRLKIQTNTITQDEKYNILAKSLYPQGANYKIRISISGTTPSGISVVTKFKINIIRNRGVLRPIVFSGFSGTHNPNAKPPVFSNSYASSRYYTTPSYGTYKNAIHCDNILTGGATKVLVNYTYKSTDFYSVTYNYEVFDNKACKLSSVGSSCKSKNTLYNIFTAYKCF